MFLVAVADPAEDFNGEQKTEWPHVGWMFLLRVAAAGIAWMWRFALKEVCVCSPQTFITPTNMGE